MRLLTRMLVAVAFMVPALSQALTWSSCQTVTAASNYLAQDNGIFISLSPGIAGCTGNYQAPYSAVSFVVGQQGVTSTNINTFLAAGLTAVVSGHQVMVLYDETTAPTCYAQVIAVGGFAGQCP
jgi:hypothetical protein